MFCLRENHECMSGSQSFALLYVNLCVRVLHVLCIAVLFSVFRRDVMVLFFTWLVLLCGLVNCSVDFSF